MGISCLVTTRGMTANGVEICELCGDYVPIYRWDDHVASHFSDSEWKGHGTRTCSLAVRSQPALEHSEE